MAITETDLKAAEARMSKVVSEGPRAVAAHYDRRTGRVVVSLETGLELAFPPRIAQGLERARPEDLDVIEVTPTGLGLHFPKLDADLYIPALLEGLLGSKSWMAALIGRAGGSARTKSKTMAARTNGKLGGRPKKVA